MSSKEKSRSHNGDLRQEAMRLAGLTLAIDAMLALFKVSVGVLSGSQALSVSALYSVNDIMSSIAVAVSLRVGGKRPTPEYQYGFGRAEYIAVAMVSLAISIGVTMMFVFSASDIVKGANDIIARLGHCVAEISAAIASGDGQARNHNVRVAAGKPHVTAEPCTRIEPQHKSDHLRGSNRVDCSGKYPGATCTVSGTPTG